ncbi:MAG TPA: HAD-IC family P-type ATPase, partial [Clostridia bacterium]|nr:HAD-IC family P-type ATPase [Clostridia bacterium]
MPNTNHEHHDQAHDHHEGADHSHHHGNIKKLFLKSLPLAIPILLFSPLMGINLPFQFSFPYSDLLSALLATLLLLYGGRPFYQGAVKEFKEKAPGMMALVSLGLSVSYLYSLYAVIVSYTSGERLMDFFFEFASLVLIMLLGHWIEMKAVGEAGDAQKSLARLLPKDVDLLLEDGSIETRPLADLAVGDVVKVQAGEQIPADGLVVRGQSGVNESLLTGESKPVQKDLNDPVIGGSTNGEGVIYVQVEETGQASFLAQVQLLISQAEKQPSRSEDLANKVAGWLFYLAVIAALAAFVVWLVIGGLQKAILYSVTTLVIACP